VSTSAAAKARRIAEREQRIVAAARSLAEERGWESVTIRRLADAIEYSQPVLYGHFPQGKSQIVTAVALAGFDELATALLRSGSTLDDDAKGAHRVRAVVTTYLDFAERHPATYEAMFRLPISAPFASAETPSSLRDGFDAIVGALRALDRPPDDLGTAAELLWAAMHGAATLRRADRLPAEHHQHRVDQLIHYFTGIRTSSTSHG